jgi:hypothetical protein
MGRVGPDGLVVLPKMPPKAYFGVLERDFIEQRRQVCKSQNSTNKTTTTNVKDSNARHEHKEHQRHATQQKHARKPAIEKIDFGENSQIREK